MGVVPDKIADKITFFETVLPNFAAHAVAIGLTPAQVVQLSTITDQARAAYNAAVSARAAARAATEAQNQFVAAMAELGGDYIKIIRTKAETDNNPAIFQLAKIPAPKPPAPLGPPDVPTELTATLGNEGQVFLRWKGSRRGGTSFSIERSTGGSFSLIGTSEFKRFTDDTVPGGVSQISYRVRASRSGGNSQASQPVTLFFSAGNVTIVSGETSEFKLAG